MKRIQKLFVLVLALITLLASLSLPAWALSKPAGSAEGSNVPELQVTTDPINMDRLISKDLDTSPLCSIKGILDSTWVTAKDITEDAQADIANHLKYGFSVAGVAKMQRAAWGAVDFCWTTGNKGSANSAGASMYGAFSYRLNQYLYNYKGEKVLNPDDGQTQNPAAAPEGFDYQMLMTFNFKKIAEIDSFALWYDNRGMKLVPQAADFYISNDGVNWTLVGYYDRIQRLLDGNDYVSNHLVSTMGPDSTTHTEASADVKLLMFDLPEGTKAQFLRVAYTANPANTDDFTSYGMGQRSWHEEASLYFTYREVFVFGALTDEVGYEYDPSLDTTTAEEGTGTVFGDGENTTALEIITKPPQDNTTATEEQLTVGEVATTADSTVTDSEKDDAKKSGCSATAGIGLVVIASIGACAAMVTKRREHK